MDKEKHKDLDLEDKQVVQELIYEVEDRLKEDLKWLGFLHEKLRVIEEKEEEQKNKGKDKKKKRNKPLSKKVLKEITDPVNIDNFVAKFNLDLYKDEEENKITQPDRDNHCQR